mmetsp:Transcript_18518/g.51678  ORF Transcript_18518/g.51678 Transcript_18518/m.51678 type:complete len:259 (-) Transcript_18518:139-915(-)
MDESRKKRTTRNRCVALRCDGFECVSGPFHCTALHCNPLHCTPPYSPLSLSRFFHHFGFLGILFLLGLRQEPSLFRLFLALAVPVRQRLLQGCHDGRKLGKLLRHVDDALAKARFLHATTTTTTTIVVVVLEFLPGLGDGGLVRAAGHAHPTGQQAKGIHRIEALAPSVDLCHAACFPLRWSHRTRVEWNPIDLILEDTSDGAVHFWRNPHVAVAPMCQRSQLDYFELFLQCRIPDGKASWIVHSHIAAQEVCVNFYC